MLPFRRDHPNRWIILVINVAFGGTIIGWGIALVWAMRAAHRVGSTSSGGSCLNLFINDVKKLQVVDPPPLPQTSPTQVGRTGRMFAAETFGVVPDVLCVAKGMSGGYAPLSAMICRRPIADAFWGPIEENPGFVEGHTFEGNPISCAAGIAVLREILERDLCGNARRQGERLRAGFERIAEKYGVIGDIRGKGLFQAVEFVRDRATREPFPDGFGVRVGRRALANGLLCRFDPNWIAFGPPLVSTAEQIDEMVAILDRSLGEVLSELPAGAVRAESPPFVTRRTAAAPRGSAWSAAVGAGPGARPSGGRGTR